MQTLSVRLQVIQIPAHILAIRVIIDPAHTAHVRRLAGVRLGRDVTLAVRLHDRRLVVDGHVGGDGWLLLLLFGLALPQQVDEGAGLGLARVEVDVVWWREDLSGVVMCGGTGSGG